MYSQRVANHSCETLREWTTSSPSFALSVVRDTLSPPCVTQKMAARAIFVSPVFFLVTHDGLSEIGTICSLLRELLHDPDKCSLPELQTWCVI